MKENVKSSPSVAVYIDAAPGTHSGAFDSEAGGILSARAGCQPLENWMLLSGAVTTLARATESAMSAACE